jgi:hypothetical protein
MSVATCGAAFPDIASAFALRASADYRPDVAREASEGGPPFIRAALYVALATILGSTTTFVPIGVAA